MNLDDMVYDRDSRRDNEIMKSLIKGKESRGMSFSNEYSIQFSQLEILRTLPPKGTYLHFRLGGKSLPSYTVEVHSTVQMTIAIFTPIEISKVLLDKEMSGQRKFLSRHSC